MAVAYLPLFRAKSGSQPPYEWAVNESSPWTPFEKDLARCRVALISTSGAYLKDRQPPFEHSDDLTFREIPRDVDVRDLAISHRFRQPDAEEDINCTFPIERLRDLEQVGFIGELAPAAYTCMGSIRSQDRLRDEMAPWLIERLRKENVDAALFVPV
ncbi:MAG: glycine/sarcosine/betaine reductase selenoprotein B family protein [Dehalococcoidia bacterium]|nr:glycine/sarcosine/betaine reductase selenoprotein B family protein [Dehalococcoidia bacterium]